MKLKQLMVTNVDRVVALALILAGAALLIVAWFGVSGKALAPEQIPYLISGGLGGIFLGAIGCTIWLSADLQDEWRRLDGIEEALSRLSDSRAPAVDTLDLAKSNGRARPAPVRTKAIT